MMSGIPMLPVSRLDELSAGLACWVASFVVCVWSSECCGDVDVHDVAIDARRIDDARSVITHFALRCFLLVNF